ncbi:MAG: hypothetical protein L6R38_004808 [Xanthoria sp. 2 TBL-2021]|nr:MAG: hypothetical protein L6R38_004808 [Xanthoria sp. 2 TBL-2021]
MDSFEGMGMPSYLGSSMPMGTIDADSYPAVLPPLDIQHGLTPTYDTGDFGITDDLSFMQPPLPLDTSHPYYENAFPDTAALMENIPPDQVLPGATSIDRDNKLLSFQPPSYNFTLLDISLRRTGISIAAQLHGMFFMAETQDQGPTGVSASATELTCYRRNLFQITGSITLPRALRYIMTDAGERIPIIGQELYISANESVEGHPVKLISVPWKTPISNTTVSPDDKAEKEPAAIPLDTMSNQEMDADFATFPIAWKRLQFRIATANNGRRKELQQHFVVRLKVVATLATGARVSICEVWSGAIIVRGRSPRNFQQRKDLPVGSGGVNNRRAVHPPAPLTRNSTTDAGHHVKSEKSPDSGHATLDNQDLQTPSTFSAWGRKPKTSTVPPPASHQSGRATFSSSNSPPHPKALTLGDSPERDMVPPRLAKVARTTSVPTTAPTMTDAAFLSSQIDSADLLYEYFPLGLDDWQPPVDAVYRPHVVHHLGPQSGGTPSDRHGRPSIGGRSKRYFSEDQSNAA